MARAANTAAGPRIYQEKNFLDYPGASAAARRGEIR
jgi:hypothetical protein